ncbi:hypothetical protein T552_03206 [Pneumocystis carinii B80]|uniref:MHD domain-containing protein n=1 Tax=Pneumocystis carinii (strain B80) TaxID=1408658 RepID=A0A0W4ZC31_PNEC8|nr:hypothetical protein T552_03206 [Pneumocystis carinii B80]KTW25932.1 hypothetical protein T552_03206 [Pneumocystis carinii B80]
MILAIYFYNQRGEVLISRIYQQDLKRSVEDVFRIHILFNKEIDSPINTIESNTFFHIKHENIYVVAVTGNNANTSLVFEFLYKIIFLHEGYFKRFNEDSIKNNFTLIYELLDEIVDFGYPQNTDINSLKMYITTNEFKSENDIKNNSSKITRHVMGTTFWRESDIKYKKNEAYLDIIENINVIMTANTTLRSDISGQIIMKSSLSGVPQCKIRFTDKVFINNSQLPTTSTNISKTEKSEYITLENCHFHQCVKLGSFNKDKSIIFIPPDGEFELMKYRVTENVRLPFLLFPIINEIGKTKVVYQLTIKASFSSDLFATDVIIKIPTPLNTANTSSKANRGKTKYESASNNIIWKIPKIAGKMEYIFAAEATLKATSDDKHWSKPPISLNFFIPMFTSSGLHLKYLKISEKESYKSVKWVRYISKAGNYEVKF